MSNFNATRFKTLLKYEITTQRKSYLRLVIASFLGLLAFMFYNAVAFIQYTNYQRAVWPEYKVPSYDTVDIFVFGCFFIFTLTLICTSHIFSNMDTKQNRIRLLMLPATNLEKFLCRWSVYVAMAFLALVVTYIAADIVAAIIRASMDLPFELSVFNALEGSPFSTTAVWTFSDLLRFLTVTSSLLAAVSTYVLGGTLFRKVPFILTSIVIGAAWLALTIASLIFIIIIANVSPTFTKLFNNIDENTVCLFIIILLVLWSTFAHWLSYRLFCRSSIIGHKRIGM